MGDSIIGTEYSLADGAIARAAVLAGQEGQLTEDMAHVLLDAVGAFRRYALEASNVSPWDDYDADERDPKTQESEWRILLDEAEEILREMISGSRDGLVGG